MKRTAIAVLAGLCLSGGLAAQASSEERSGEESSSAVEADYETSLDYAQVREVEVTPTGAGSYRFSVTVRHNDEGWDHYADEWQVYDPETGEVYGTRELLHPHDNEQPFTRSLSDVEIPDDVTVVAVRAKCNVHGYGGREVVVDLATVRE